MHQKLQQTTHAHETTATYATKYHPPTNTMLDAVLQYLSINFLWVKNAPFGFPVVPDV